MNKTPAFIIIFRYILVAGLLYSIWTGHMWALRLTCTIAILHSEFLYIANRLTEIQVSKQAKSVLDAMAKEGKVKNAEK